MTPFGTDYALLMFISGVCGTGALVNRATGKEGMGHTANPRYLVDAAFGQVGVERFHRRSSADQHYYLQA